MICVGDSHVCLLSPTGEQHPGYPYISDTRTVRIGPQTAYNLNKRLDLLTAIISKEECVLWSFGEIDIRAHLAKHKNTEECVSKYVDVIKGFKSGRHIVYGPIASMPRNTHLTVGTPSERNDITRMFTLFLNDACISSGFKFFSIFNEMLKPDGSTDPECLCPDGHHASVKLRPLAMTKLSKLLN